MHARTGPIGAACGVPLPRDSDVRPPARLIARRPACKAPASERSRRIRLDPVFEMQAGHTGKLTNVIGDQRRADRQRLSCDPQIIRADRRALALQVGADSGLHAADRSVDRNDLDPLDYRGETRPVMFGAGAFFDTCFKFAQDHWRENQRRGGGRFEAGAKRSVSLERRDEDIGIQ